MSDVRQRKGAFNITAEVTPVTEGKLRQFKWRKNSPSHRFALSSFQLYRISPRKAWGTRVRGAHWCDHDHVSASCCMLMVPNLYLEGNPFSFTFLSPFWHICLHLYLRRTMVLFLFLLQLRSSTPNFRRWPSKQYRPSIRVSYTQYGYCSRHFCKFLRQAKWWRDNLQSREINWIIAWMDGFLSWWPYRL